MWKTPRSTTGLQSHWVFRPTPVGQARSNVPVPPVAAKPEGRRRPAPGRSSPKELHRRLSLDCDSCGGSLPSDAVFCQLCGAKRPSGSPAPKRSPSPPNLLEGVFRLPQVSAHRSTASSLPPGGAKRHPLRITWSPSSPIPDDSETDIVPVFSPSHGKTVIGTGAEAFYTPSNVRPPGGMRSPSPGPLRSPRRSPSPRMTGRQGARRLSRSPSPPAASTPLPVDGRYSCMSFKSGRAGSPTPTPLPGLLGEPSLDAVSLPKVVSVLCRGEISYLMQQAEDFSVATARLRHDKDVKERQSSRRKAAAWRRACERRDREEMLRRKAAQLAEEERQQELALQRDRDKDKWCKVLERISERKKRMTIGVSDDDDETALQESEKYAEGVNAGLPGPITLDHKIDMMRKAQKVKKRLERRLRQLADWKHEFQLFSEKDRHNFEATFKLFDKNGNRVVSSQELRDGLWEFGLRGLDMEERKTEYKVCEQVAATNLKMSDGADAGCEIYEFAMHVVPNVRRQFMKLRQESMMQMFSMKDADGSGRIPADECLDAVRTMTRIDIDKTMMHDATDELKRNAGVLTGRGNVVMAGPFAQASSADNVDGPSYDFRQFELLVARMTELSQRNAAGEQRRIQNKRNLDEATFSDFRSELIPLNKVFDRVDFDASGELDPRETLLLFKELGMIPNSPIDKMQISKIVERHKEVDFKQFLHLVHDVRNVIELRHEEQLKKIFLKHKDVDDHSIIHTAGVSRVLEDIGMETKTRREQDIVVRIIHESDREDTGRYSFKQVKRIWQRVKEQLHQLKLFAEEEVAQKCKFSTEEIGEFRFAFEQLDADGSGSLDTGEVKQAMVILNKTFVHEGQFENAMKQMDSDGSGSLEFTEFLSLLQMLRDEEGVFSVEQTPLTTLAKLNRKGIFMLLERFKQGRETLEDYGDEELVARVCILLEIEDKTCQIREYIEVADFSELLDFAGRLHMERGGMPQDMMRALAELTEAHNSVMEQQKAAAAEAEAAHEGA